MQNISKNLWFSIANIVVTTLVTLFSIKFLLNGLGAVKFGLFSIITILNSLSSLLSFGLNYTLLHYLPKQGKSNESNLDIVVVLIISFSISILIAIGVFVLSPQIAQLIKVPNELLKELIVFIKYIALTIIFLMPIQILFAVFDAEHKNFVSNILQAIFTTLYWLILAVLSFYTNNLEHYGLALLILYPLWYIILSLVFYKIWGSLSVQNFKEEFSRIVNKHIKTGFTYFVTNLLGYFNEPVSKLLLSRYIGLDVVAYFDIAMRVKNQVWGLFSKITYPFLPYFSSMKDKQEVKKLIVNLTGIIFVLSCMLSLYLWVSGDFLVRIWLHNDSAVVANFVKASVATYLLFSAVVFPMYYYFIAENKAIYLSIIQLIGSLFNIVFFFLLKSSFQDYAIMISQLISLFLAAISCFWLFSKYMNGFGKETMRKWVSTIFLIIPLTLLSILTLLLKDIFVSQFLLFISFSTIFLVVSIFTFRRKSFVNNYLSSGMFANNKWINKFLIGS